MSKEIRKKTLSALLAAVLLVSALGCLVIPASAAASVAGTWTGSTTAANGTVYSMTLTLSEDGTYTFANAYAMGGTTYHETENGKYAVKDNAVTFTGDKLVVEAMGKTVDAGSCEGTVDGASMTLVRHASFMAKTMGKDPVSITMKKEAAAAAPKAEAPAKGAAAATAAPVGKPVSPKTGDASPAVAFALLGAVLAAGWTVRAKKSSGR